MIYFELQMSNVRSLLIIKSNKDMESEFKMIVIIHIHVHALLFDR